MEITFRLGYIDINEKIEINKKLDDIGKMITGLQHTLREKC